MKLKEEIHTSVNQMNISELILLYEHIRLLEEVRLGLSRKRADVPIEEILEMTSSSPGCWSDTVIQNRMESIQFRMLQTSALDVVQAIPVMSSK